MDETTRERRWRIGELAEATGLTVRTLHHYEQIGLLSPADRSEGGHRLYDEHDVRRLYRIRALRELGLSLEEIGRTLESDGAGLHDVLGAHLAQVDAELARLGRLRVRLERAREHTDGLDAEELLGTIEAMTRLESHVDARLAEGAPTEDLATIWRALGDELRACRDAGEPPTSPRVLALARRMQARLQTFAAGDPAVLDALGRFRRGTARFDQSGWDAELLRYMDRALSALEQEEDA